MNSLIRALHLVQALQKALKDVRDTGIAPKRPVKSGNAVEKRGKWMGDRAPEVSEPGDQFHDYSHLLSSKHREAGYQLVVRTPGNPAWQIHEGGDQLHLPWGNPNTQGTVSALLVRRGKVLGHVHVHNYRGLAQPHSQLAASLRGQGLGTAMYEAALAHSVRYAGAVETMGSPSELAGAVHERLAEKHKLRNLDGSPVTRAAQGYNYRLVPQRPQKTEKPWESHRDLDLLIRTRS